MKRKFLSAVVLGTLLATSGGVFTSCKDNDDDIKHLQEQVDTNTKSLDDKIGALTSALDQAKTELSSAKAAIAEAEKKAQAAQAAATAAQAAGDAAAKAAAETQKAAAEAQKAAAAAQASAAQAKADAIAEAQKMAVELKAQVDNKVEQSDYDAKMKGIDAHVDFAKGKIETLEATHVAIKAQIQAMQEFQKLVEELNLEVQINEINGKIDKLTTELTQLGKDVTAFMETYKNDKVALDQKFVEVKSALGELGAQVGELQKGLSILTNLLSHRLTSIVFAPNNFINGIETIDFATLQYTPWKNLLADKSDGSAVTSINDGKTTAYYYANPSTVSKEDVLKLAVLTQNGTNTITKAGESKDFTATLIEIKDGKMEISFKKNMEGSLNKPSDGNKEYFLLAAIKAEIKTTSEELKNGLSPFVISDWVRLSETSDNPFIHNRKYDLGVTEDLESCKDPHFYPYTKINNGGANGVSTTRGKYIHAYVPYNQSLDLKELVGVCNKKGKSFATADYGLAFEFNLVDYHFRTDGEEKTNQKEFAKITDGVITSQARNGESNNRSAIGREPMIQIILRNTANKDVVDVRYMKVKWVGVNAEQDLGILQSFTGKFDQASCGINYIQTVGTKEMNDRIYAILNLSKEEFHHNYKLDKNVYASLEDAKVGKASVINGSIIELTPDGSQTTYNLRWTLPIATNSVTKAEYEAGKAKRVVYGRYLKGTVDNEQEVVTFAMALELTITKMMFDGGYNQSYWNAGSVLSNTNKDKTFQVNPALTDDATYGIAKFYDCQIITSILKAYNKNTGNLSSAMDLVKNATSARFVFDEARIKELLGDEWGVFDDGTTLKYNRSTGAVIHEDKIMLYEFGMPNLNATTGGKPSPAAIALLGKTVPVKLVASLCGENQEIKADLDRFNVNFINPLELKVAAVTKSFKDLLTGGSTIEIKDNAEIYETFGLKRAVWKLGKPVTVGKLNQWYGVENVTWDLKNAKTNLKKEGNNIIISNDPMASDWSLFADKYIVEAAPDAVNAEKLTFRNNSGAHLQQEFTISIPVYAKTKWTDKLYNSTTKYVQIKVTPGDAK